MAMLSEIFMNNRYEMPEDAKNLLIKIAPVEYWQGHYDGGFNSIKWNNKRYAQNLYEVSPTDFLSMWWKSVKVSPVAASKSFCHVTSVALDPLFCLPKTAIWCCGYFDDFYVLKMGLRYFFFAPGMSVVLLLLAGLIGWIRHGIKILPFVLPLLAYNFGTAMFLFGTEDHRFFYAVLLTAPAAVVACLSPPDEPDKKAETPVIQ